MKFAGANFRLPAYDSFTFDKFAATIAFGDQPSSGEELDRKVVSVLNTNIIDMQVSLPMWLRMRCLVEAFYRNANPVCYKRLHVQCSTSLFLFRNYLLLNYFFCIFKSFFEFVIHQNIIKRIRKFHFPFYLLYPLLQTLFRFCLPAR